MRHVIVGNGPAGISAAVTLRRISPRDQVTVIAEETQPFYSKVVSTYFVGGKVPYEKLLLADSEQLQRQGIDLVTGRRAVSVNSVTREVTVSGGENVGAVREPSPRYDRLLLATGAAPLVPPIEGAGSSGHSRMPGVFTLWTHDDAVALKEQAEKGRRAVVIGAGLVGLKGAEAFLMRGLSVTVVETLDRVLPQVLAADDAAMVRKALERRGLAIRTGITVVRIAGGRRVERVELSDGAILECDLVLMATGVRANLSLAVSAGAAVGRGILVDEFMQTSVPGVFAAGDVAEGWDVARGGKAPNRTWGNASEQGRVAAYNMAGRRKPFNGAVAVNTFTFMGFSMAAVGLTQDESGIFRVETYSDPRTGDYRKLVLLGDRPVGGVAIGNVGMAGIWRGLIARQRGDGPLAAALLPGRTNFALSHLA